MKESTGSMVRKKKTAAVVLAAGSGRRMGGNVKKQYMLLGGRPLISYCLKIFQNSSVIDSVVLVTGADEIEYCRREIKEKFSFDKIKDITAGGAERFDSVLMGLRKCPPDTDIVFIHDGARPFVTEDIIQKSYNDAYRYGACTAAVRAKDTIRIVDSDERKMVTPNRDSVWQIQTPQTFDFQTVLGAYEKLEGSRESLKKEGVKITDDAMVVERFAGIQPYMTEGDYSNIKVTTPEDLIYAEALVKSHIE